LAASGQSRGSPDDNAFPYVVRRYSLPLVEAEWKSSAGRTSTGCHLAEGTVKGTFTDVVYEHSTTNGYPWDKVFILDANGKYYEELINAENLEFNHRRIAFDKLKHYLI
jgi:inosine/xanthosine triphosphate pyrophosphatase family protein